MHEERQSADRDASGNDERRVVDRRRFLLDAARYGIVGTGGIFLINDVSAGAFVDPLTPTRGPDPSPMYICNCACACTPPGCNCAAECTCNPSCACKCNCPCPCPCTCSCGSCACSCGCSCVCQCACACNCVCSAQPRATMSASDYDGQKTVPRQQRIGGGSVGNNTTLHGTGQASQGAATGANHSHSEKHNAIATTRADQNAGDYDSGKATDEASEQAAIRNNVTASIDAWVNQRDLQAASVDLAENEWWADETNV